MRSALHSIWMLVRDRLLAVTGYSVPAEKKAARPAGGRPTAKFAAKRMQKPRR